ncbi:P-loop containing nucleoside triphosphate hydrolase protein, partial [Cyathus striatus]
DKDTDYILCSNDRPEIALMVRRLVYPANSFKDLSFLIPKDLHEGSEPPKFLVFFDSTKETESACKYLRMLMPRSLHMKIRYFHLTMSITFREHHLEELKKANLWGLCCTDAFGMGMDLPNINIVVQYKATSDLCTLWQHFSRAARGAGKQATGILLVEAKDVAEG